MPFDLVPYEQMLPNYYATREEWLTKAHALLWEVFLADVDGLKYPKHVRIACSLCAGSKAIGQAWYPKTSEDGASSILICQTQADPLRVLDILLHEMLHHACHSTWDHPGHGKPFKEMMSVVGLVGKATATYVKAGSECEFKLKQVLQVVGSYPHAALIKVPKGKAKKAYVTLQSVNEESYKVRVTHKVFEMGPPLDPWGDEMRVIDQ